jgi:hypothetical protein
VITILKPEAFISIGVLNLNEFSFIQPNLSKRELEKAGTIYLLNKLFNGHKINLQYTITNKPFWLIDQSTCQYPIHMTIWLL